MRYVYTLVAVCVLLAGVALAQVFPQTTPQPQAQQPIQPAPVVNAQSNNTIPAGTQLSIRTNEAIVADKNTAPRNYSAEISQDVIGPNGQVLIPRGSPAELSVGPVTSGTLGVGSNEVGLQLRSVTIGGNTYMVTSNTTQQGGNRGIGANKRTAEITGGGALLGTVIGAVAGGAKGAAIGAVVGGGAGAATQVLTRGSQVKVPAETVLTFRLDQPLVLQ